MRKIFKATVVGLIWLWSKLYSYKTSIWLKSKKCTLYTYWLSNYIGWIGKDSRVKPPCTITGGGEKQISIGKNTLIQANCILGCWAKYGGYVYNPSIVIGDDCIIGEYNHFSAIDRITIGNGVLTGNYVYIGDNSHGNMSPEDLQMPPCNRGLTSKGEVVIEDNVWIGDKVAILSGVRIGKGAVVGANSVVTKDVEPYTVVGGNPARIIKTIIKDNEQ